jgi:nodulation protein E
MTKRVVITGMGCISALGHDLASNWQSLCDQRSGITHHSKLVNDDERFAMEGPLAMLADCDLAPIAERFGERAIVGLDPFSEYALPATLEATDQAGLTGDPCLAKAAVVYGAGAGGQSALDEAYQRVYIKGSRAVHPLTIPRFMPSAAASQLSLVFGVKGPCFAVSSACSSSAHAMIEAVHMIRSGRINVAIAGGSEAPYTFGHWLAWKAIRAMADDTCRPFSQGRKGMVLGEGAATLVLEERSHALARGATILGELIGAIGNSDAHHITQPQGDGAVAALHDAYAEAGIARDTPALISAHGTGTALNDKVESAALREFYGNAIERTRIIATKSAHGHLIGATGALEFVLGLKALTERIAPPVLNYLGEDPDCVLPLVTGQPQAIDAEILVSNTFAFGGLNAVLIGQLH